MDLETGSDLFSWFRKKGTTYAISRTWESIECYLFGYYCGEINGLNHSLILFLLCLHKLIVKNAPIKFTINHQYFKAWPLNRTKVAFYINQKDENRIEKSEQRKTSKNIVELEVERKHKGKEIIGGAIEIKEQDEQWRLLKTEDQ